MVQSNGVTYRSNDSFSGCDPFHRGRHTSVAIARVLPRLPLISAAIVVLVHSRAPIPCSASNSCSLSAMAIPISRGSKLPWRSLVIKHLLVAWVWWMACQDGTTACIQTTTGSNPNALQGSKRSEAHFHPPTSERDEKQKEP